MKKKRQIQVGLLLGQLRRLLDFGREEGFQNYSGELKNATVATRMVLFLLDLRREAAVEAYLQKKGGTLLGLIRRAVYQLIKNEG